MKCLLAVLATAASVSAHGWVDNATIGGQFYQLYQPYQDPYMSDPPERISRKITSNGPVQDVTSIDLQCGGISSEGVVGSEPAALHAPVEAGSTVNLKWTLWPDSHMGPLLTYMARCPDEGCDKWLPGEEPVFFKIHHDGRHTTDKTYPDDIWATTPLMIPYNGGYNYTIPPCLAPGYYLVRHEILALHSAWAEGEAQFYPSCHQLQVTGGGSVVPGEESLVSIPGVYAADDPGVFINVWNPGDYSIPGPEVWKCPE
ncbi:family 61 putative glycoside hydrolase [Corynascus novoguineensis]|uniref:lytic cellulose monooxygenase (C4-dehydrogenating) n=1 Tax=Corynascus novoguineensis TaxID=1126955 RepID=A0AAN7CSI4_9PEZI|nr:family 61 putative glycoside hydrolase [Corynascus novoguineensis]